MKSRKHEGVAAVLSFFIPGLGQIFNGEILYGILYLIAFLMASSLSMGLALIALTGVVGILIGMLIPLAIWGYGIYDAYKTALEINAELDKEEQI